jgi:pimeloyl-ACP methyl ester carboxylesterase
VVGHRIGPALHRLRRSLSPALRLIVVDSGMERGEGGGNRPPRQSAAGVRIGRCRHGAFRQLSTRIATAAQRPLVKVERADAQRDPDFQNTRPQGEGAGLPQRAPRDVWQDLAAVKCPIMVVRGTRSDRYTPEILARMTRDYPHIEWATVNSQHDVADQAPQELVAAVRKFTASA